MKSIYSKKDNVLREQPEYGKQGDGFMRQLDYEISKQRCRTLPCAPNSFVDGVEYEEGKHYELKLLDDCGWHGGWGAVPITQSNDEDDVWEEFDDYIGELTKNETHNGYTFEDILPKLKSRFTITRKGA